MEKYIEASTDMNFSRARIGVQGVDNAESRLHGSGCDAGLERTRSNVQNGCTRGLRTSSGGGWDYDIGMNLVGSH